MIQKESSECSIHMPAAVNTTMPASGLLFVVVIATEIPAAPVPGMPIAKKMLMAN